MQVKIILPFLLLTWFGFTKIQSALNRGNYYEAITGNDVSRMDVQLAVLEKLGGHEAFTAALLMKKSGLLADAKEKLRLFKAGHQHLEASIAKDSLNTEYRFLRLLIQENAPKIVNYNKEIKKDASYLRKNFKNLPSVLQNTILDYSKRSEELKPEDFKTAGND